MQHQHSLANVAPAHPRRGAALHYTTGWKQALSTVSSRGIRYHWQVSVQPITVSSAAQELQPIATAEHDLRGPDGPRSGPQNGRSSFPIVVFAIEGW
jgi:hypothetical protein